MSWSNAGGPPICVSPGPGAQAHGPLGRSHEPHAGFGLGLGASAAAWDEALCASELGSASVRGGDVAALVGPAEVARAVVGVVELDDLAADHRVAAADAWLAVLLFAFGGDPASMLDAIATSGG